MKRLLQLFCLSLVLVSLVCVPAFADEVQDPGESVESEFTTDTITSEVDDKNIIVNVTVPSIPTPSESDVSSDEIDSDWEDGLEAVPVYTPYSTYDLTSASVERDPESLAGIIESLFGVYTPRTQTVTEYLSDGSSVTYDAYVSGVAGMDWEWLCGVGVFSLMLLSFFKMIGGALKRG